MSTRPRRHRLAFDERELRWLREAVDSSLCIPEALSKVPFEGRETALDAIKGTVLVSQTGPRPNGMSKSVVKQRPLNAKRSQRSNWPSKKKDRDRVKRRTEERRRLGLQSTVVRPDRDAFHPPDDVRSALRKAIKLISEKTGIEAGDLQPRAVVSCVQGEIPPRRHQGRRIRLSIHEDTALISFVNDGEETIVPLAKGEALSFDCAIPHREKEGDWQRTLDFEVVSARAS